MVLYLGLNISLNNNIHFWEMYPFKVHILKVDEEDTVTPVMQWYTTPTLTSGALTLYFSEAVQATTLGGANVTEVSGGADSGSCTSSVPSCGID